MPISQALSSDPAPAVGDARPVSFDPAGEYWISDHRWVNAGGQVIVNTWFKQAGPFGETFWGDGKMIPYWDPDYQMLKYSSPANSIYKFEVRDSLDPTNFNAWTSFCAHYGSTTLGEDKSYVAGALNADLKADILAALNYIYDTYGSIDAWQIDKESGWNGQIGAPLDRPITLEGSVRVLSQIIIWMLLDDNIEMIKAQYAIPGGPDYSPCFGVFDDAVGQVFAAIAGGYAGSGTISDVAYLVGPNYPNDETVQQPQLIPLYDEPTTKDPDTGSLTLTKSVDNQKVTNKGSITGGYPSEAVGNDHTKYPHCLATALGVTNGGSWFQYNGALDFNAQSSYTFDLVQGSKLNTVGAYTITYNGGKNFTVTFANDFTTKDAKLSIANVMKYAQNKGDPNTIWTTEPGSQQMKFSGNTYSFDAPWLDLSAPVYVYIHLDGLEGYTNALVKAGMTFDVKVTGPSYPSGAIFKVPVNGSLTIDDLLPGEYTVKEIANGWKATYFVNGGSAQTTASVKVDVAANGTANVLIKNEPVTEPPMGGIDVKAEAQIEYYNDHYKPIYKVAGPDTLVSWVGYGKNEASYGGGVTGKILEDNGFTFLKINKEQLKAAGDAGVNIGIATSNKPGKAISADWNTFVGSYYNIKIQGDKLIVTCNSLAGGDFGVLLSDKPWTANPNGKDLKHNNATTYAMPAGAEFYLFFHVDKGKWYTNTIIGYELDYVEGPLYMAADVTLTYTVVSAADGSVFQSARALGLVDGCPPGDYYVSILVDGAVFKTETVTVVSGENTLVDFGVLIVDNKRFTIGKL
ncbi:MAG: hypothetical protein FWC44_00030 [Methanomassiliicoccaceae archaeon]|nr:hypothetical protein [Methanomassiliicoccaceae archaeon]